MRNGVFYKVNSETAFTGKVVWKYPSGQKKEDFNYKDGERHGLSNEWFESGQMKSEETFNDGKLDGLKRIWFESGQKEEDWFWKDGLAKEGKIWRSDGQIVFQRTVDAWGHPNEKTFEYHGNGQLSRARTVADYSGNYFVDYSSLSLQQEWYENGQQRYEKNYKDGELHGLETYWHENGQIWLKKTYKNGVENGPAASWYKDGQRKAEETYKEGDIVAPSIYWDESGTKRKEIVNDTGTWLLETNWNASGQKESQYTLDNGKRNGLLPFTTVTGRKKPRTFLAMVRTCSVRANSGMSLENLRRARHTLEFLAKIRWIDSRGC